MEPCLRALARVNMSGPVPPASDTTRDACGPAMQEDVNVSSEGRTGEASKPPRSPALHMKATWPCSCRQERRNASDRRGARAHLQESS